MATKEEVREQAQPLSHRSGGINDADDALMMGATVTGRALTNRSNASGLNESDDELMRSPIKPDTTKGSWTPLSSTGGAQNSDIDWAGASGNPWMQTQTQTLAGSDLLGLADTGVGGVPSQNNEEEGSEYETDDGADDELIILPSSPGIGHSQNKTFTDALTNHEDDALAQAVKGTTHPVIQSEGRLYQNPLCRPIAKVGNMEIGLSQAKLFGLLDENGELRLKLPGSSDAPPRPKAEALKALAALSAPRDLALEDYEDEEAAELTFKPVKNKASEAAMRNPRCGYDFVDRLKERGDFLERAFGSGTSEKMNRKLLEGEKEDYEARLDKLACPSCKKEQSFDEFKSKKRECSQCKVRFTTLKVFNASSFEKRQREAAAKKEAKLAAIDSIMYGNVGVTAVNKITNNSLPPAPTSQEASQASLRRKSEANSIASSVGGGSGNKEKERKKGKEGQQKDKEQKPRSRSNSNEGGLAIGSLDQLQKMQQKQLMLAISQGGGGNAIDIVQQLAKMQNEKHDLLQQTIKEAERQYSEREKEDKELKRAGGGGDRLKEKDKENNENEKEKEKKRRGKAVDDTAEKFNALLDL